MSSKFRPGTLTAYVYDILVVDSKNPMHQRHTDNEIIKEAKKEYKNHKISRNAVRMYRSLARKHAPASVEISSSQKILLERKKILALLT